MHSVIILSSPPNTFARSPTPADSSSPLQSPRTLLGTQRTQYTPRRFKTVNVQRDGFGTGFSSARTLLQPRVGAENFPVKLPIGANGEQKVLSPKRFKSPVVGRRVKDVNMSSITIAKDDPIHDEDTSKTPMMANETAAPVWTLKRFNSAPAGAFCRTATAMKQQVVPTTALDGVYPNNHDDPFVLPDSSPNEHEAANSRPRQEQNEKSAETFIPLDIDMAVSRRIDWTPPKDSLAASGGSSPSVSLSRSFSGSLLGSFGYNGDTAVVAPASRYDIDDAPTKRRRIDMVEASTVNGHGSMPPPKIAPKKKVKAAPKKPLTITGLATSNYACKDMDQQDPTILDRFLSAQAQALEADRDDLTSEIAKVKAVTKQRVSKKPSKKSTLVSPTSAMKELANQNALFGSASQLARDESPNLLCDTLEAIRQSELSSSPVRTQDTEQISINSTIPRAKTGISRFTKKRGLWAAAGRDEDNALLHDEAIDIDTFNTPDLRLAFPGKDVLLQPSSNRTRSSRSAERLSPSLRGGGLSHLRASSVWDFEAMESPVGLSSDSSLSKVYLRTLHTISRIDSPRKRGSTPTREIFASEKAVTAGADTESAASKVAEKRASRKPAFAGFTTGKLQKQIAAFGLKPIKSREQMIVVLEKCWAAKQAAAGGANAAQEEVVLKIDETLKHSDHLSSVHDLANRPVPKEKKEPKPRKKREPKVAKEKDPAAPKVIRKGKSERMLLEVDVIDVENIQSAVDATILTEEAQIALAEAAIERATAKRKAAGKPKSKPKPRTPSKAASKNTTKAASKSAAKSASNTKGKRPATPPAMSSPVMSSPVFEYSVPACEPPASVSSIPEPSIDDQISVAITSYQAPPSTNHQRQPTWHEKILMYDPIILEDLATWLNTEGLGKIGEDREVSALEVREWCEARGVCCLWRGGWRGNKGDKSEGGELI